MICKNRLSLSQKLLLTQILAFIIVYAVVMSVVPSVVYSISSRPEVETAMHFNEQVGMRISQCFNELKRFSGVVASDDELNRLLKEYITSPNDANMANLRLFLSNTGHKDGVSSYRVLGIYLEIYGDCPFSTNTVGLSESTKSYIRREILPEYEKNDKKIMLMEPFVFSQGDSTTLFGGNFTKGYGYVQEYHKNGMEGRLVVISSYDEIVYIVQDIGDYCEDYVLLNEENKVIQPGTAYSSIDCGKVLQNMQYGDSYLEGSYVAEEGIYAVRWLDPGGWKLISYLTRDEVLSKNRSQSLMILFSVALFGIVVMIALIMIVRKFIRPLSEVSEQMRAIAQGDLKVRVMIRSQDEIGRVGEAFNIMASRLEKMIDEIVEKEKLEQTMRYLSLIHI